MLTLDPVLRRLLQNAGWLLASDATAVQPFRLLLVASGVAVATLWATPATLGSGHPAVATKAAASGAACLVALFVGLVPARGATGAAGARVGGAMGYLVIVGPWLTRILRQESERVPPPREPRRSDPPARPQ